MFWYVAIAILALIGVGVLYYSLGSTRTAHPLPWSDTADTAGSQGTVSTEPLATKGSSSEPSMARGTASLQVILSADLRGRPGYFTTKWEAQAPYQLYVELIGNGSHSTKHEILEGFLPFWRGGTGRTNYDAGYKLSASDLEVIDQRLAQFIGSLQIHGWDVSSVLEQIREALPFAAHGIQVGDVQIPFDVSPKPGMYRLVVLSAELAVCSS